MFGEWLGWLGLLLCLSEWLTWFCRKYKLQGLRRFRGKYHIRCGELTVMFLLAHGISALLLSKAISGLMVATGIAAGLCLLVLYGTYQFRRQLGARWLGLHRVAAVTMLVLTVGHLAMCFAID